MRRVARRDNRIHNQDFSTRPKGAVACLKNPCCRVVIPVVKDVLHDNRVGARRQFAKEVAAFDSHSARDASTSECPGCAGCDMWKIEQYTTHLLVATQDRGQQKAMSARDVHQRYYSFEVVRAGSCTGLSRADRAHP